MKYKKTLRWVEPFGGWGDHSRFTGNETIEEGVDTGLCNRIFHWEIAHYISEKNNFQYTILVQELYWPELTIIDLPHTIGFKANRYEFGLGHPKQYNDLKFLAVFDIDNKTIYKCEPLHKEKLESLFLKDDFELPNHIYSDFGYDELRRLFTLENYHELPPTGYNYRSRPLQGIKIKFLYIDTLIKQFAKNSIGIHIRRGSGVIVTEEDINSIPESLRTDYKEFLKKHKVEVSRYPYIRDEIYFSIIDEILKINPEEKFYISSDLPKKYLQYYYDKYKNNILDNSNLIYMINDFLVLNNIDVIKLKYYGNVIENLVDLFSLSYSKFLIMSNYSTWSEFAKYYVWGPSVNVMDGLEKILITYKQINLTKII